jgi:FixJ family two-component response regulator
MFRTSGTSGHAERIKELTERNSPNKEDTSMVREKLVGSLLCERRAVLIVEDDVQVAEFMEVLILESKLFDVCIAHTCDSARKLFHPGRYFAVILDLNLDGSIENGISLALDFREKDDNVFIAVITGFYPVYDGRLIDTVDDLMGKPIDRNCFQSKLFMWSVKYNRRKALKTYINEKLTMYSQELQEIRGLELSIRNQMVSLASSLGMLNGSDEFTCTE